MSSLPPAIAWLDRLKHISDLSFDRDGRSVLATISPSSAPRGQSAASRIWRFELDGSSRQLTRGPNSDGRAKPSPIDDRIAFTSDCITRGKRDLFILDGMSDARPIGAVPGTIDEFAWSPDGRAIIVLSADRGLNGGATNGATRLWWGDEEDPEVTAPGVGLRRLFEIDVTSGSTVEVGPAELTVWEFDLVPGGAVAVVSEDASERGWYHPRLARIDFETRRATTIYRTEWQLQGLVADREGRRVAFLEGWSSDRGLVAGEMRLLDLETRDCSVLASDRQSNVTALSWRDAESLWFTGWRGLGSVYGVVATSGEIVWEREEKATIGENQFVATMAVSPDGQRLLAVRETIGQPKEIYFKEVPTEDWRRLSWINDDVASGYPDYPEIRHIKWLGKDGLSLESFVYIPSGVGRGPQPMIVNIHGGPCMSTKFGFDPYMGLGFAAAGYIVFCPNYRGNVGWGQDVTRMNLGDPAGAEFEDILAGIDRCIELGLADPERIGVTGASYGGYLSAWAVATTDKFKAAIPVSSICDQLSSHYSCEHDFHDFINGGSLQIEANRMVAIDRSPLMRLEKPTTPTLLIQGREDRCTPLGQAQEFYSALKERGVIAELVIYPRAGHWLMETEQRMDSWCRQISWFDRFLRPAC